ncbi:hypothetical protein ACGFNU_01275 [Spirillospora sp. NPDC048911]|uniref:hypothetical protein n=1 Tax=Spirillospora sp. NPDC048911 TaxID=3364527 RepID=UPI00371DBA99
MALASAAVTAVPLLSVPAEAATVTLKVTGVTRKGKKASFTASVQNTKTGSEFRLRSGVSKKVAKGTYTVLAEIPSLGADGYTNSTLGAQVVSLSRSRTVAFDARKGRALTVGLDVDKAKYSQWGQRAAVCTFGAGNRMELEATNSAGGLFVIPNGSGKLAFSYLSEWHPQVSTVGAPETYALTGYSKGIPAKPSYSFRRASLAKTTLYVRRGPALSRDTDVRLAPAPARGKCGLWGVTDRISAPFTYTAHVTPGRWQSETYSMYGPNSIGVGGWSSPVRSYAKGKSYAEVFNRAVWGPARWLPKVSGRALSYYPDDLFADPGKSGSECCAKAAVTFRKGSRTIKSKVITQWGGTRDFSAKIPSAGWYTLSVDARRYHPQVSTPAGILSPRATISWKFYAKPAGSARIPVALTRYIASGLDSANQAAPGSTTGLSMWLNAVKGAPKVRTATVQASFDDGRTWRRVSVRKRGSGWAVSVPNASAKGYVTLRSTIVDVKGNRSVQTIYRAYGIR